MSEVSIQRRSSAVEDELPQFLSFIRQNAGLLILCTVLCGALGGAYAKFRTPVYTARTQLLLSPRPSAPLQTLDNIIIFDAPYVDSQIAVLQSGGLTQLIIKELDLINDDELASPPGNSVSGPITEFQKRLSVRRDGMSYAINVAFTSRDPAKAARISNAVAQAYIRDQISERSQQAKQRYEWLEDRIVTIRKNMNEANRSVQAFRARGDFTIPAEGSSRGEPSLGELEARATTYRKLIENYLYAQAESSQEQFLALANSRIITPAIPPAESNTKILWLVSAGTLAGAILGAALSLVGGSARLSHLRSRLLPT